MTQQTEWMDTVFPDRGVPDRVMSTRRAVFEQTEVPADDPPGTGWGTPTVTSSEHMTPWWRTVCANLRGGAWTAVCLTAYGALIVVLVLALTHIVGWLS